MFIAYYDESGDDGYPNYSSPIFVLTCLYIHHAEWKEAYEEIYNLRKFFKESFGLPIKMEFHAKYFLLNKNPYRKLNIPDGTRIFLINELCSLISVLNLKIVNVVINKTVIKMPHYDILDTALTYSIQRIENDLSQIDPARRFMIITDEGRVAKMRKTTRKIQKINYIPSKFNPRPYRKNIKLLIEDPLPKESKESYFIQICDLVAYIVYLYYITNLGISNLPSRLPSQVGVKKIKEWMDTLKSSFNLKAAEGDPYGIVCYPR